MTVIWASFVAFILLLLALDLGVFHRKAHVVGTQEALKWSAAWISLGLAFSAAVYFLYESHCCGIGLSTDLMSVSEANPLGRNDGRAAALKYLTGYLIEKSLSVDNIFVIAMVFGMLKVPPEQRHRVLFWGVLGALAMRGAMIGVGAKLIAAFGWIIYVFGGLLIATALKMMLARENASGAADNALVRWARRTLPVGEFGLAVIVVEFTDLVFAVDSIPAIFAITTDPFLVFTSNVFAILGLRSLYFALEGMMDRFHHLKTALGLVLLLVGMKMLAHPWLKAVLGGNFNLWILLVILSLLAGGVIASLAFPKIDKEGN